MFLHSVRLATCYRCTALIDWCRKGTESLDALIAPNKLTDVTTIFKSRMSVTIQGIMVVVLYNCLTCVSNVALYSRRWQLLVVELP